MIVDVVTLSGFIVVSVLIGWLSLRDKRAKWRRAEGITMAVAMFSLSVYFLVSLVW
ncbi:MAG: hypothetical protein AB7W59_11465 [Acidimicrobiia bacterium]